MLYCLELEWNKELRTYKLKGDEERKSESDPQVLLASVFFKKIGII